MPLGLGCRGEGWCLPCLAGSCGTCWKKGRDTVPSLTMHRGDVPKVHVEKEDGRARTREGGSMQTFNKKTRLFQHINDWDIAERTREQRHSQAELKALVGLGSCPILWLRYEGFVQKPTQAKIVRLYNSPSLPRGHLALKLGKKYCRVDPVAQPSQKCSFSWPLHQAYWN